MGKSPGKWIKTVIFGKKSSKSSSGKKSATSEKGDVVSSKASSFGDTSLRSATIGTGESSDKARNNVRLIDEIFLNSVSEKKQTGKTEKTMLDQQEQAAKTAQAIIRGYLARRSFRSIKAIVRLQALIRRHLVRRQAISTLHCTKGIVALQALSRGRRVRASDIGREVHKRIGSQSLSGFSTIPRKERLSSNAFVGKLVASRQNTIPLCSGYDLVAPNSAWQWMERWSSFKFWGPISQKKKDIDKKITKKKGNLQIKKSDLSRLRQVEERVSKLNNRKLLSDLTREKQKTTTPKKPEAKDEPSKLERPSNDLERVKQNLRRISASTKVTLSSSQPIVEMPKSVPKKSVEKSDEIEEKLDDKLSDQDNLSKTAEILEDEAKDCEEKTATIKEEKTFQIDLPRKLEFLENFPQRSIHVPNYMKSTKAAKAKLQGFESPRFEDEFDDSFSRRLSLPLYANGKPSLLSPRSEKIIGRRENKPLVSSTDGFGKSSRPDWRR